MQGKKKIAIYLMTFKGLKVFQELIANNLKDSIYYICIGKDRNVENDYSQEIEKLCIANGINYSFNNSETEFQKPDYIIAISWRWIIKENIPIIVLHDSLLPKYRGFAPLVNSLKNGEKKIGVTALFANENYDTGPIILQESTQINYPIKINTAIEMVSDLYSNIVIKIINMFNSENEIRSNPQNEADATYSLWLDDEDYYINWDLDSDSILRFINATGFPYLGAKTRMENLDIIIQDAEIYNDIEIVNRTPGKIVFFKDSRPVVVCGQGLIKIINAIDLKTNESIFPLNKFRIKFI